jgi:lysozyme
MRTNTEGLGIIKRYETCQLKAYLPTPNDVWTIGYGHTEDVKEGDTCTQGQADDWLKSDLASRELQVEKLVTVKLNENEFSALVSLLFNIGYGNLRKSGLLMLLNKGNYNEAAFKFKEYNKQKGIVLNGLTKRRTEESLLFTRRIENV